MTSGGWETARWAALQRAAGRPETTVRLRLYHVERAARELLRPAAEVTVDHLAATHRCRRTRCARA